MQEALESLSMDNYLQFPAQRYFMFMGPWQSHRVYLAGMALLLVCLLVMAVLHRKRLFTKPTEEC